MTSSGMIFIFSLILFFFPTPLEGTLTSSPKPRQNITESQKPIRGFKNPTQNNKQTIENQRPVISPRGRKSRISFSRSLPEDISNENFPDVIESFDYPNVPLMDLIQAIGKLTGLNFIIDPGVANKKITILAPSKITVAEAYKAFLSALAANGYTVVKSGAFWKIRETKNALKDNTEIYSGGYFPNTDQLITRIIKLKYINAKEFSKSIKPLASTGQQVSFHEASNTIIISDYGSTIERIMKLVRVMDVPGSEESVTIIPIIHAAATDLAQILNELLSGKASYNVRSTRRRTTPRVSTGSLTGKKSGNIKVSHIIPDERTNSLIVSANKNGLKRVKGLVKKLDTYVDPSRTGGIYVYNVLYGTAEQVYNTLMGIKPQSPSAVKAPTYLRAPTSSTRGRTAGSRSLPSSTSALFPNVTIMADPNTNSLIISARNKYDFERVKAVLKKIDVPKDQVFVQAVIVEMYVGQGDSWETNLIKILDEKLGKKIAESLGFSTDTGASIASFVSGGGVGFLNKQFSPDLETLKKLSFGPGFVLGLPLSNFLGNTNQGSSNIRDIQEYSRRNGIDYDSIDFDSDEAKTMRRDFNKYLQQQGDHLFSRAFAFPTTVLQILKEVGDVNVLSTPQITAMDNIPAVIEVGENAPIGLTTTSSGLGTSNEVARADITLRLQLTPRINPDSGIIQMDISQKFDDLSDTKSSASELRSRAVHTVKRFIETKLVLHDGETAVLGGLMTDKEVRTENKIPLLGDIPILGWLFKGSTVKKQKRNLIVFLTPTIIRGKDQKNQNRQLLGKKLEERIEFIKKNMKGKDPYGKFLKKLTAKTMDAPIESTESEEAIVPDSQEVEWVEDPSDSISDESPESQEMKIIEPQKEESPSLWDGPGVLPETSPSIRPSQNTEEKLLAPVLTEEKPDTEWVEEPDVEEPQTAEDSTPVSKEPSPKTKSFWDKILNKKSEENQEMEVIEEPEEPQEASETDENKSSADEAEEDKESLANENKTSTDTLPTEGKPAMDQNKEPVLIENIELFPKEE